MTDNLEPGWYWVKLDEPWPGMDRECPARWSGEAWTSAQFKNVQMLGLFTVTSPRLTPPEGE